MGRDDWDRLSDWHSSWLAADPVSRQRLREQLAADQPSLIAQADALVAGSHALDGFLETPALFVAAQNVAADTVTLASGERLGPYQVVGLLAQGGMGDVYRATDIRLQRDVALKMLAHPGTPDPRRVERFMQEARITAALDHPNIVRVFDVGIHRNRPYIVAELLEGETLRSRLAAGSIPIAEIRRLATEIAKGLVVAHGASLVHCDLKPENVFLTRSGGVKILDFGIAKLAQEAVTSSGVSTLSGVVLGTAGYLAPEQIEGATVDARTDLFALGSMLFEALTGTRAFGRPQVVDTLHAILHDPLPDIAARRDDVPPALVAVIERLVEKDPNARFQSATDLAWTLERLDTLSIARSPAAAPARASSKRARMAGLGLAAAAVAIVMFGIGGSRPPAVDLAGSDRPMARFTWTLPPGIELASAAVISPDQTRLVFAGLGPAGVRLYVRELGSLSLTEVPGTEGAKQPFWSPDSRALGFFAKGKLFKLAVPGGTPVEVASAPDARGGAWGANNTIVFQPLYRDSPLLRVSADGGRPEPVTVIDAAAGDVSHRWPAFLPDGVHVLYQAIGAHDDRLGVFLRDIHAPASMPGTFLFRSEGGAAYAAPSTRAAGFLLSAMGDHIEARPFDPVALKITGDARRIEVAAAGSGPRAEALLSATADVLVSSPGGTRWGVHPGSIARDGTDLQIWPDVELGGWLRFSPDGRRLSRTIVDLAHANPDIWVEDLTTRTKVRVTRSIDLDVSAVWSADGRRLAFRTGTVREAHLALAAADGTGIEKTIPCPTTICEPTDWSADGALLLVNAGPGIWTVPTNGEKARPLLSGPFDARDARFSPDGGWIAYVSNESGRPEVSVRSMASDVRRYVISPGGGDQPVWRRDGQELLYVGPDTRMRSVSVRAAAGGGLTFGAPTLLNIPPLGERHWGTVYDVRPDGQRIVLPRASAAPAPRELHILLHWLRLVD
ncbi:MAG TPA: protein kinase [Vicinamibacterales bacterium]|nr:protein kinase [Vicinamibacterales bacterium]